MSNEAYYKFEQAFIKAVMTGEADVIRGALAGLIKRNNDANFVRDLASGLQTNADHGSGFRADLNKIHRELADAP